MRVARHGVAAAMGADDCKGRDDQNLQDNEF